MGTERAGLGCSLFPLAPQDLQLLPKTIKLCLKSLSWNLRLLEIVSGYSVGHRPTFENGSLC